MLSFVPLRARAGQNPLGAETSQRFNGKGSFPENGLCLGQFRARQQIWADLWAQGQFLGQSWAGGHLLAIINVVGVAPAPLSLSLPPMISWHLSVFSIQWLIHQVFGLPGTLASHFQCVEVLGSPWLLSKQPILSLKVSSGKFPWHSGCSECHSLHFVVLRTSFLMCDLFS